MSVPGSGAFAPFLRDVRLRALPEGPLLLARVDRAALDRVALPFDLPPAVSTAAPRRRADFAAGRLLAHLAQLRLGWAPCLVGIGPDRAPVWPSGLAGSITHTASAAAVWLSDRPGLSLGIDLEARLGEPGPDADGRDARSLRALRHRVLSPDELARIGPDPRAAIRVFSAKETLFKALYPAVGSHFGFGAAEVVLDAEDRVRLVLTRDLAPGLRAGAPFDIVAETQQNAVFTRLAVAHAARPAAGGGSP